MPNNKPNIFERRSDLLVPKITKRIAATNDAFGVGNRPFRHQALSGQEKAEYFRSLGPEKQAELWGQMDDAEREQIREHMGGEQPKGVNDGQFPLR